MSEGSVTVDTSRWPIVVHTGVGVPPRSAIDDYIAEATKILERKELHVTILDVRRVTGTSAYIHGRSREWLKAHRAELARYSAGIVYVVGSPLVRFLVAGTLLLARYPTPYLVCETLDEGFAWAHERLEKTSRPS